MPLSNMMLSEVTPGGMGTGLYGILVLAVLSVFVAGLMVGRTPEYLGKKIEPREMKLVSLYILLTPITVLVLAALALSIPSARRVDLQPGRARPLRGPLRLHVGDQQQRQRVRRAEREHHLLQHRPRRSRC